MDMRSTVDATPKRFTCHHCGADLDTMEVVFGGRSWTVPVWTSCGCDASRLDGQNVGSDEARYYLAGIPRRFIGADQGYAAEYAADVIAGRSLYITGPYGSGKTHLACALAKAVIDAGQSVRFENSKRLITEIQGTYDGKRTDALDRAYGCRVLVLDDLGKEQPTEYSISMLYEVIDTRYAAGKPIVVTTNFERDELLSRLARRDAATAEAIVSRLCDNVSVLRMGGSDRRLA